MAKLLHFFVTARYSAFYNVNGMLKSFRTALFRVVFTCLVLCQDGHLNIAPDI
jgi:hypothetical protein